MIATLAKRDWDTGTPAYRAAEAAMADMLKAADELMAAHQGALPSLVAWATSRADSELVPTPNSRVAAAGSQPSSGSLGLPDFQFDHSQRLAGRDAQIGVEGVESAIAARRACLQVRE